MAEIRLGTIKSRFADIIWEYEPILSSELVKLAEEKLKWKKSATYTVLKRLCTKGLFENNKGTVASLVSRQEFYALQSEQFAEEAFEGSLPAFLIAYTARKALSPEEIEQLRRILAEYEE